MEKKKVKKAGAISRDRDQYTIVLEDIRSNIKSIGETLLSLDERMERMELRMARLCPE